MVSPSEHELDSTTAKEGDTSLPSSAEWDVSYAGVVRYTISSMLRRSAKFLRRGLRVRPRTLAHSTDRLKELVEFREHYLTAHEGHEGSHTATTTESTTNQSEVKRSRFRQIAREVLPGFIKHVGFATIVFSSYETIYDDYYLDYQHELHDHSQSSNLYRKFISLAGPFLCGGVSGTLGGIYYVSWDKVAGAWHRFRGAHTIHGHHAHAVKSVIASHSLVQSTLFSSYEVMKWGFLHSHLHRSLSVFCDSYLPTWISLDHGDHSTSTTPTKFSAFRHHGYPNSFAADLLSILLCGATAGVVSETVQHWIKLYDLLRSNSTQKEELYLILKQSGWIHRFSNYRHVFLPSSHSAINAALPMSLAFLAYEYGKAVSAHEQHHNPSISH